jgi:hypothetical protein
MLIVLQEDSCLDVSYFGETYCLVNVVRGMLRMPFNSYVFVEIVCCTFNCWLCSDLGDGRGIDLQGRVSNLRQTRPHQSLSWHRQTTLTSWLMPSGVRARARRRVPRALGRCTNT